MVLSAKQVNRSVRMAVAADLACAISQLDSNNAAADGSVFKQGVNRVIVVAWDVVDCVGSVRGSRLISPSNREHEAGAEAVRRPHKRAYVDFVLGVVYADSEVSSHHFTSVRAIHRYATTNTAATIALPKITPLLSSFITHHHQETSLVTAIKVIVTPTQHISDQNEASLAHRLFLRDADQYRIRPNAAIK